MRTVVVMLVIVALGHGARAETEVDGFLGIEMGPTLAATGALGDRVEPGFGGSFRAGLRAGRIGIELHAGGRAVDLAADETPEVRTPSLSDWRSGLSYYAVAWGPLQLLAHVELGFAIIGGSRSRTVACRVDEECPGGVRVEDEDVSFHGFGVHTGATLQVHLGRRGHQHPMLWATATTAALRFRFASETASGRTLSLGFGAALAF